jgi:hypothetical protein
MIRRSTGVPFLDVHADFRSARRAYRLARTVRRLTRQPPPERPPALSDAAVSGDGPARLEVVPISRIVGTLDPSGDFDARFRPASEVTRRRWERVALAYRRGIPLPPIALHEGPDGYYVIDGRHRVSVARALGQADIDAWVTAGRSRAPGGSRVGAAA